MRVNFVTKSDDRLASYRYRIEAPAMELAKRGHAVSIGEFDNTCDTVVFSKHFDMQHDYELMKRCKGETKTVFDICDNHFSDQYADYYKTMCKLADRIVVGTYEMTHKLDKSHISKTSVVNDPYEFPLREPRFDTDDPKLLWFGHPSNLYSLERVLPEISEYELRIVSNTEKMPSIPWSVKAVREGLEWCDLVIIPATDSTKGNNRAIESFRSGRFVVAEPHPALSLLPCHKGGIKDGIEWCIDHPSMVINCIESAQMDIEHLYSPEVIGAQWERALV